MKTIKIHRRGFPREVRAGWCVWFRLASDRYALKWLVERRSSRYLWVSPATSSQGGWTCVRYGDGFERFFGREVRA